LAGFWTRIYGAGDGDGAATVDLITNVMCVDVVGDNRRWR
jgi:hypothetical protein